MEIREVAVLGCGLMGSGIAQVSASAGFPTIVLEATEALCERGRGNILKRLDRLVEKESLSATDKTSIEGRLRFTTHKAQLANCDLVIEAVIENFEEKNSLLRSFDPLLK